jgi:hypothetical protein
MKISDELATTATLLLRWIRRWMWLIAGKDIDNTTCPHRGRSTIICRPAVLLLCRLCYPAVSRSTRLLCAHFQEFCTQILKDLYTKYGHYTITYKLDVRGSVHHSTNKKKNVQRDATMYQNFIIPYLYEAQHVSGDTPPIIRSLKLHWQPLVFYTWKVVWTSSW